MSEINNYDPNPYDDVTIDEALAQIYDRVNDRTIRQMVTLLKNTAGDTSRYTIEKATAESGEVTYKLMQQISGGTPTPVGVTVGLRGSQILANYDEELQILDNIISIIKAALDGKQDAIDSLHKLSADFVDDTGATNKFATEEELEQIEANKNNILSLQEQVGYAISELEGVL